MNIETKEFWEPLGCKIQETCNGVIIIIEDLVCGGTFSLTLKKTHKEIDIYKYLGARRKEMLPIIENHLEDFEHEPDWPRICADEKWRSQS